MSLLLLFPGSSRAALSMPQGRSLVVLTSNGGSRLQLAGSGRCGVTLKPAPYRFQLTSDGRGKVTV